MNDRNVLLDHTAEVGPGEFMHEITYGFRVRNRGRRVARGVLASLVKVEVRHQDDEKFRQGSVHTYALPWYGVGSDRQPAVLVPNTSATVVLAGWREDLDVIVPMIGGMEEYYEDSCGGAVQFRFTVAVVEENGEHTSRELTIENP